MVEVPPTYFNWSAGKQSPLICCSAEPEGSFSPPLLQALQYTNTVIIAIVQPRKRFATLREYRERPQLPTCEHTSKTKQLHRLTLFLFTQYNVPYEPHRTIFWTNKILAQHLHRQIKISNNFKTFLLSKQTVTLSNEFLFICEIRFEYRSNVFFTAFIVFQVTKYDVANPIEKFFFYTQFAI